MKTQLTLTEYFFEEVSLLLPKFPKPKTKSMRTALRGEYSFYEHSGDKNRYAVRWEFLIVPKTKTSKNSKIKMKVVVVGLVKIGKNDFNDKQRIEYLYKNVDNLLYEKIRSPLFEIFKNSMILKMSLPKSLKSIQKSNPTPDFKN
jgi:hypothetical protein